MAGHVACTGEMRNAYEILGGKSEGKRPFWRHRHRWEDNIKIYIKEIVYELDSNGLGECPILGSCEHCKELPGFIKGGKFHDQLSD
jgi:hypothetical protein